jgi:hypothetical protein
MAPDGFKASTWSRWKGVGESFWREVNGLPAEPLGLE